MSRGTDFLRLVTIFLRHDSFFCGPPPHKKHALPPTTATHLWPPMAFSATETSLVLSPSNPRSLFIIVVVNIGTTVLLRKRILLHRRTWRFLQDRHHFWPCWRGWCTKMNRVSHSFRYPLYFQWSFWDIHCKNCSEWAWKLVPAVKVRCARFIASIECRLVNLSAVNTVFPIVLF